MVHKVLPGRFMMPTFYTHITQANLLYSNLLYSVILHKEFRT